MLPRGALAIAASELTGRASATNPAMPMIAAAIPERFQTEAIVEVPGCRPHLHDSDGRSAGKLSRRLPRGEGKFVAELQQTGSIEPRDNPCRILHIDAVVLAEGFGHQR